MSLIRLTQIVTYWVPGASDSNGDRTYAAGVAVKARWASKDGIFTDVKGDDQRTEFAVYTKEKIPKRSMLALGDFDAVASPTSDARIVLKDSNNESMTTIRKYAL